MKKIIFIICTEKGTLEKKSILLVKSIRKFAGKYKNCDILSFSPRKGEEISVKGREELNKLGVKHYNIPLNTMYTDYPLANKPLVCSYVEKNYKSDYLIFLDSDKLILNEPSEIVFDSKYDLALRPVDIKNIGSNGEDENSVYWKKLYNILNITEYNYVTTTVDKEKVFQYWNSGFISIKSGKKIFQLWKENFEKIMRLNIQPKQGTFFLEQSIFAATVSSLNLNVIELSKGYNYPIHIQRNLEGFKRLDELVSIHYHHILESFDFVKNILDLDMHEDTREFLIKNIAVIEKIKND